MYRDITLEKAPFYIHPCLGPQVNYSYLPSEVTETIETVINSCTITGLYGEFHFFEILFQK